MTSTSSKPRALFLSNFPWDYLWQRHQTLASLFARDYAVTYAEFPGVRRVGLRDYRRLLDRLRRFTGSEASRRARVGLSPGVSLARPFIVPSTNRVFHALNRRLLERFLWHCPGLVPGVEVIVTYTAARSALYLIDRVPHKTLIYDCTDNFMAIPRMPKCFAGDEQALLRRADLTLVPGKNLAERHSSVARRLEIVRHGAVVERFALRGPSSVRAMIHPKLVYYGHVYRQHLDCDLIIKLAKLRPDWRIVLVGPILSQVDFPPNVLLPGPRPHEQLRIFLSEAQAIILPYAINDYTRSVFPAKTYECLATGLPIISTPLPELCRAFPEMITYAETAEGFAAATEGFMLNDTPGQREARIAAARANSWDERYARVRELIAEVTPN